MQTFKERLASLWPGERQAKIAADIDMTMAGFSRIWHDCGELCQPDHIHHSDFVLVCNQCGAVNEQSMSPEWLALRQRVADTGFILNDEHIVLTGMCSQCRTQNENLK